MALTLAERLAHCVTKFPPARPQNDKNGSPYNLLTLPDGRVRAELTNDEGDKISGTGATLEDAVTALENKVNG